MFLIFFKFACRSIVSNGFNWHGNCFVIFPKFFFFFFIFYWLMEVWCLHQFQRQGHPQHICRPSIWCLQKGRHYRLLGQWETWERKNYFARAFECNRKIEICCCHLLKKLCIFALVLKWTCKDCSVRERENLACFLWCGAIRCTETRRNFRTWLYQTWTKFQRGPGENVESCFESSWRNRWMACNK